MAQNAISDELKFKVLLGGMPPDPPSMSCLQQLLEDSLSFINLAIPYIFSSSAP